MSIANRVIGSPPGYSRGQLNYAEGTTDFPAPKEPEGGWLDPDALAKDSDFVESEHPRAPDGKFGSGSAAPLKVSELTKVGKQMGSNPGGVYQDKGGKKFYVKQGRSSDHVKTELAAADLYALAGARTLNYRPVEGGKYIATEMAKLDKNNANKMSPQEVKAAQEDFVTHAWLANWDAVGLGGDNVGTVGGKPVALDLGGALSYRAQGAPKGNAFGNTVGELDTLRSKSINPDAARLFGKIDPDTLRRSAEKVTSIPDAKIKSVISSRGLHPALADKLIARKKDIAKRLKVTAADESLEVISDDILDEAYERDRLRFLRGFIRVKVTDDNDQWDSFYNADTDSITLESKFGDMTDDEKLRTFLHEAGHRGAYRINPDLFSLFKRENLDKLESFKEMANPAHLEDLERTGHVDNLAQEVFAESYSRWCLGLALPDDLAAFWERTGTAQDEFNEKDHPRGQPANAGQFAPAGGGSSAVVHPDKTAKHSSQVPFVDLRTKLKSLVAEGFYGKPESEKQAQSLARQLVHGYSLKIKELLKSGKFKQADAAVGKAKKYGKHLPYAEQKELKQFAANVHSTTLGGTYDPTKFETKPNAAAPKPVEAPKPSAAEAQAVKEMTQASTQQYAETHNTQQTQQYSKEEQESFADLVGIAGMSGAKGYATAAQSKIKATPKLFGALTPAEAAHILAYTGNQYVATNQALRAGVMDEKRWRHVRALNKALEKVPDHVGTVYRKANMPPDIAKLYQPGMVVEERGFTSSSKNKGTWHGSYHFEISSKSGKDVQKMSLHGGEAEVLFQSGSRFKVISRTGQTIRMEQVE